MKGDCEEYYVRDDVKKLINRGNSQGKIKNLLADLLEKEEELTVYKNRLKELEAAFYYNLELISERDLELSILEKQLAAENEQLEDVIRERNELEDLIKTIDEKKNRKIQQLEARLKLKEEEIKDLQRENLNNINSLKKIIEEVKQKQDKKISKMNYKFESQKNELIRNYREQIEEKEKYYLLEIDNLSGKLEQACKEKEKLADAEEEIRDLKYHLEDLEKLFLEKENNYLEEIKKINKNYLRKVSKEVQCACSPQATEKTVQAEPKTKVSDSQTTKSFDHSPEQEEKYKEKINFLQEQNEVLKFIIKDLKRNRECADQPPGCECERLRGEVEKLNKKFETEINNLRKILEREQKTKAEEDAVIRSLETSVTSLKNKLLLGLQGKLQQLSGNGYNRICDTEIQMTLLEERLCEKIDTIVTTTEKERQKIEEKLEELKKYVDEMEKCLKSKKEEPKTENLVEKIRTEIRKLENKIENDLKKILGPSVARATRRDKNSIPLSVDFSENCCDNYFSTKNWGEEFEIDSPGKREKNQMTLRKFNNELMVGR